MANINFLCHEPWHNNHGNVIIRATPYLESHGHKITVTLAAGHVKQWPELDEVTERLRRRNLADAAQAAIKGKPDFILCHHRSITPDLLRSNIPLAILEHTDAPALEICRNLIHLDNVIGVIKGTVFTDLNSYNGPFCEGMFHGPSINDMSLPCEYPQRKISDLSKIELGYSFGSFPSNKRLLDKDIDDPRSIDVSFVGTIDYPRSRLITKYRKLALATVKKIKNGIGSNGVPVDEFDRILMSSRVCVSPLGYGACYRSFEGIYAGCVVVQPDCSYMKSWPDIYIPNQGFVPCKSDFSDLENVTSSIVDNWQNWHDQRHTNKEMLVNSYWNEESLGKHLKGILDRCSQRIK